MKKLTAVLLVFAIITAIFTLCACNQTEDVLNLYVPDGAPALAVAKLLQSPTVAGKSVKVTITTGANVKAKMLSGEADLAICPTNMGAGLYNQGADYQFVCANVFGVLYMVSNNTTITSLNQLKGKVVHSIGKDNTPQYVLQAILNANGIAFEEGDVAKDGVVVIKYYQSAAQILPLYKSNMIDVALIGEPAVSLQGLNQIFDLQQLWQQATGLDENYPQAGLFVKSNILQQDKRFVNKLVQALQDNTSFLQQNASQVSQLLADNGSVDLKDKAFTGEILARCNIRCVKAADCKAELVAYFNAVKAVSPAFVLPNENFYYGI